MPSMVVVGVVLDKSIVFPERNPRNPTCCCFYLCHCSYPVGDPCLHLRSHSRLRLSLSWVARGVWERATQLPIPPSDTEFLRKVTVPAVAGDETVVAVEGEWDWNRPSYV